MNQIYFLLIKITQKQESKRKFRIQFLDHNGKSGDENCAACIRELRKFFEINDRETFVNHIQTNNSSSSSFQDNQANQTEASNADSSMRDQIYNYRTNTQQALSIKDLTKVLYQIIWHLLSLLINFVFNLRICYKQTKKNCH